MADNSAYSVGQSPKLTSNVGSGDKYLSSSDGNYSQTVRGGIPGFFAKLAGIDLDTYDDRIYEMNKVNSARAWDEYMDSTKYQRSVQDMKKAGLNPYMMAMNGFSSGSSAASSASTGSSEGSGSQSSASGIAAILKVLATLLA